MACPQPPKAGRRSAAAYSAAKRSTIAAVGSTAWMWFTPCPADQMFFQA